MARRGGFLIRPIHFYILGAVSLLFALFGCFADAEPNMWVGLVFFAGLGGLLIWLGILYGRKYPGKKPKDRSSR